LIAPVAATLQIMDVDATAAESGVARATAALAIVAPDELAGVFAATALPQARGCGTWPHHRGLVYGDRDGRDVHRAWRAGRGPSP